MIMYIDDHNPSSLESISIEFLFKMHAFKDMKVGEKSKKANVKTEWPFSNLVRY